jgi:hypothetical protein
LEDDRKAENKIGWLKEKEEIIKELESKHDKRRNV